MELLKKYFAEHCNDHYLFWEDISETSPVKNEIEKLCAEYGITKNIETLDKLYFVANVVRFRSDSLTPKQQYKPQLKYKKELFTLFIKILNKRKKHFKEEKPLFKTIILKQNSNSEKITDSLLLLQYEKFILDSVSELFTGEKWNQLNKQIEYEGNVFDETFHVKNDERGQIITEVKKWLNEFGQPQTGRPEKNYFVGLFLQSLESFIREQVNHSFESDRELQKFMGKLCVIYKLVNPGDPEFLIKTIQNQLPNNS